MKPFPFFGGSVDLIQSLHCDRDDFFSVSCSACGSSFSGFRTLLSSEFF